VSVLAIGPKVRWFKPCRDVGFLRAIKVRSTPSFGGEVKPEAPCHNILRYVKNYLQVWTRILLKAKFSFISPIPPVCCQKTLLVVLTESSGRRISFPLSTSSFHHGFPYSNVTWGLNCRSVGCRSSETQSHPIDMIMIIILHLLPGLQNGRFPKCYLFYKFLFNNSC
jgi:hypothetical protein